MGNHKVTIRDVLNICGVPYRGNRSNDYIPCPLCDQQGGRRKHLNVNFDKDVFRCPKCDTGGGPIALYGFMAKGIYPDSLKSDSDRFMELVKELNEITGNVEIYHYEPKYEERKPVDFPPTDVKSRDEAYSALFSHLSLSDDHYNSLVKRGLREKDIFSAGYVTTPIIGIKQIPINLRHEGIQLAGVPGFFKFEQGRWTMTQMGRGIYIPVRELSGIAERGLGYIQGIQNRQDNPRHGNKYMWLSSRDKESGCGAETWCHFAGYPEKEILLTEGPLKADVIYRFTNKPVLAVPGVNALGHLDDFLSTLSSLGVKKIDTAFDMDFRTNPHVQKGYANLIEKIQSYGFDYEMLLWDENYKGLDDYLLHVYLSKGGRLDPLK